MATSSEDSALDLQTMYVLRGTDDLRKRLMIELSTGTPSISDLTYAVKVRIKEDYKIAEKVRRKRLERPDYGVPDLRDIVGLRLVTLYRLDALRIVPALLDKIRPVKADPSAVFTGKVEEIVIYSTNPYGDPHSLAERLLAVFKAKELGGVARVETIPSNYTSIHIVTLCRGKYRGDYREIPVEIQIRTALEDVWSEIDHGLKYKRHSSEKENNAIDRVEEGRLQAGLSHLNVMKTLIDGVAQYADQIKIQLDDIGERRLLSSATKPAEDSLEHLSRIEGVPPPLMAAARAAVERVAPAFRPGELSATDRFSLLRSGVAEFRDLIEAIEGSQLPSSGAQAELRFVVEAEYALLLFELGNAIDNGSAVLTAAARVLDSLQRRFPERAVIRYRLAKVLDALGDRDAAISILEMALPDLDDPDRTDSRHWMRAAARRVLGVLYWERGAALRRAGVGNSSLPAARHLEDLFAAYRMSREARALVPGLEDPNGELSKAANNVLWFALEFMDEGGSPLRLGEDGFNSATVGELLDDMGMSGDPTNLDIRLLDTARRAYLHLGDTQNALKAARWVRERYEHARAADAGPIRSDDESALRAAQSLLDSEGEST